MPMIEIFNRSHYENVLATRVNPQWLFRSLDLRYPKARSRPRCSHRQEND